MQTLQGKVAVVTGASSGIGRAIALALAQQGVVICAVGRSTTALGRLAGEAGSQACIFEADLGDDRAVHALAAFADGTLKRVDILVHAAGLHAIGALQDAPIDQLDRLYRLNLRAPYLLTQLLLPLLRAARGEIVFINSSQGTIASARGGQYAATKHALKAIADSLRDEVNASGVRVLSVFPGRTATPTMERLYESEKKSYDAGLLLQPDDIAAAVVGALTLPRTAELTNLSLRPFVKSY
jgi:NADP-dependent 3-hydroxy acid dehydrogenase YdfG